MKTTTANEPRYWIGEAPVYPGHPVTCALIVLLAYRDGLEAAWRRTDHGWLKCEGELDVPTAGGALTAGCALIRHVLGGAMSIDGAIAWGDRGWEGAGGHPGNERPGQDQADCLKGRLRGELEAVAALGAAGGAS